MTYKLIKDKFKNYFLIFLLQITLLLRDFLIKEIKLRH
jgi:hypothetical protein